MSDVSSDGVNDSVAWDSGYQHDIIDGVTVYYGGDLCDSEESDWEDPEDVARREYVEQYNFDLYEGMEPLVFVPGGIPSRSDRRDPTGLIYMTATITVFMATNRLWIVNVKLGGNTVLRCFERDLVRFLRMRLCRRQWVSVGTDWIRKRIGGIRNLLCITLTYMKSHMHQLL